MEMMAKKNNEELTSKRQTGLLLYTPVIYYSVLWVCYDSQTECSTNMYQPESEGGLMV